MKDYSVARNLFTFIELALWLGVLVGIGTVFAALGMASRSYGAAPGIIAAIPGLAISAMSLFGIATTQMGRATVDTAEYGQQALKVARDQLEISKQAMKQGAGLENSFADLAQRLAASADGSTEPASKRVGYGAQNSRSTSADDAQANSRIDVEGNAITRGERVKSSGSEPSLSLNGPKPYADQLGTNPAVKLETQTFDINGKKLTQHPDGTFEYEGHSFVSIDSVKEHLRLSSLSGRPRRKPL